MSKGNNMNLIVELIVLVFSSCTTRISSNEFAKAKMLCNADHNFQIENFMVGFNRYDKKEMADSFYINILDSSGFVVETKTQPIEYNVDSSLGSNNLIYNVNVPTFTINKEVEIKSGKISINFKRFVLGPNRGFDASGNEAMAIGCRLDSVYTNVGGWAISNNSIILNKMDETIQSKKN